MAGAVVVVGAGVAGLGTAWELAARGLEVTVLERAARPGGRAVSESVEGVSFDVGWPVLSDRDSRMLAWIDAVGLRDEMLPLRPVLSAQLRGGSVSPARARNVLGVARLPGVRPIEALRLFRLGRLLRRYGPAIDPATPERAVRFDDRSVADFGRLYFGASVLDRWMAPSVTVPALCDPAEASRVLYLHGVGSAGARPGLPRQTLGELTERAAARLKTHCGAQVQRIEVHGRGMQVAFRGAGEAERVIDADAVVLANAAPDALALARPLLSAAERDFLGGVSYTASIHLCAGLRRPFSLHPEVVTVPRSEASPLEAVLFEPGVAGGRVPAGQGVAMLRARGSFSDTHLEAPDEVIEKALLEALEGIHRGAGSAIHATRLFRMSLAHPRFDVGRYRALATFLRVQADRRAHGRRLYFAGDYLMHPSWEGALGSAHRAAAAVVSDVGASSQT